MRLSITVLFLAFSFFCAFSQKYSIRGSVHDVESGDYLPAATVSLTPGNLHVQTNENGLFVFENLSRNNYLVTVQFIGFEKFTAPILLSKDTLLHIDLRPISYSLSEVVVEAGLHNKEQLSALSVEEVGRNYLLQNNAVNFVKTLSSIPGVASMDIGAGSSKPVIRGLGFNRVAVVDKGIVQQNQQWGADHGLEIDQYDVDNVRVHKGPLSLLYGSDAIGGVIEILPVEIPVENSFWGDATLISKSNNRLLGASVMTSAKLNNWFYRARVTLQDYGDYKIPVDTITYLTWKMPVHGRRMKNTAGKEYNTSLSVNYDNSIVQSWLHVSNIYGKNGFFPGAHGIPDIARLQPDASSRNIEMPFSSSNHFRITNNSSIRFARSKLNIDVGFQQNKRQEMSRFHTHYANQSPPTENPDLELSFLLNTFSANARLLFDEDKVWSKTIGVSSEYQHNRVGGYSFLLPNFDRISAGVFMLNNVKLNNRLSLAGGLRFDVGKVSVKGFFDPVLEAYLRTQDYTPDEVASYAQRAAALDKTFNDFSGSIGLVYNKSANETWKINIGKSFRYPSANELASNGVHHGAFRHEKGNTQLLSEKGYQLDVGYEYASRLVSFSATPFVSYFSNYIFLEPSGRWSILPHSGQLYEYQQAKAIVAGGEIAGTYHFTRHWSASANAEYIYNLNLTDGYPLPFSPPATLSANISYSGTGQKALKTYVIRFENNYIAPQNRIARNEEKTPQALLFNASANMHWRIGDFSFITDFQVQNIFNTAFLNHLSFYRKLNAPEPGRNIQLIVKIPFGTT